MQLRAGLLSSMSSQMAALSNREPKGRGMPSESFLPGFEIREIETVGTRIQSAMGGSGPPLLLLHGYPQTHLTWHKIASC